jgi:hypothetical protein
MADLTDIQSSQSVKLVGSSSSGAEQTFVAATNNGELSIADISNNGGVNGSVSVSTSAVEAKVSGTALTNRKNLTLFNNSSNTVYWGYSSSVSTSNGTPLFKNQYVSFSIGENTAIWLIAASGSNDIRVTENA